MTLLKVNARLRRAGMLLAACAAVSSAGATQARPQDDARDGVRQAELALRLAAWGREQRSAQALILAARMLGDLSFRDRPSEGTVETAEGTPAPDHPAGEAPLSRDALLAQARLFANGDPALLKQIAIVAASGSKGVVAQSPVRYWREVPARGAWSISFRAEGGEIMLLSAASDGDSPLELEIRDAQGRVACADRRVAVEVSCQFRPAFEAAYTARLVNRGAVWSRVVAVSN